MREVKIENQLRLKTERLGGKCLKFSSPGNNGVPDRIVLLDGGCYFVELKAPGKTLRPTQRYVKKEFEKLGFTVTVIDSLPGVEAFINEIHTTRIPEDKL